MPPHAPFVPHTHDRGEHQFPHQGSPLHPSHPPHMPPPPFFMHGGIHHGGGVGGGFGFWHHAHMFDFNGGRGRPGPRWGRRGGHRGGRAGPYDSGRGRSFREEFYDDGLHRVHNVWLEHEDGVLPHTQKVAQELALEIMEQTELDAGTTTVLDFAFDATAFFASRVLHPHVKSLLGVAIDDGAVQAYNSYSPDAQMHAVRVPFMGHLSSLDGRLFDIVLCAQPIEQRPDVADVIPALTQFVKPGGSIFLVTIDLTVRSLESEEPYGSNYETRILELFRQAGLESSSIASVDSYGFSPAEPGVMYVARAVKPQDGDTSTIDEDDD